MTSTRKSNEEGISNLKTHQQFNINLMSGFVTGVVCSALFNPWDRALFLAMKHDRPFSDIENFKSPYHGWRQTLMQRAFMGSIYYMLQGEFNYYLYPYLRHQVGTSEATAQFCVGLLSGCFSGMLGNSVSSIKYHTWGHPDRTFHSSLKEMWSVGGLQPFLKGTTSTMARDMIFGSTYELSRYFFKNVIASTSNHKNNVYLEFAANALAGGIATIFSSPLNYARNMQYATPLHLKIPTLLQVLHPVVNESKTQLGLLAKMGMFQQKFKLGSSAARVAVGMGVGQKVFDESRERLEEFMQWRQKLSDFRD